MNRRERRMIRHGRHTDFQVFHRIHMRESPLCCTDRRLIHRTMTEFLKASPLKVPSGFKFVYTTPCPPNSPKKAN